jgi:hypothetical protein
VPRYTCSQTPHLNAESVSQAADTPYAEVRMRLAAAHGKVLATMRELSASELLDASVYEWAGKRPVARWIALNTARQYTAARAHLRRALR